MLAVTLGTTLLGIEARPVEIETELTQGLPHFSIIGLGDAAVQEARYRVQSALRASEIHLPHKKITINLAPADLRKDGASLDLPMALGLLCAAGFLGESSIAHTIAIGELALSGAIRRVKGVLPAVELARQLGCHRIIVPAENGPEASAASEGIEVLAAPNLRSLLSHLEGNTALPPSVRPRTSNKGCIHPDLQEVRGQKEAKRALELAAAGNHNLLLVGNPGSGKTMLARRLPSILPSFQRAEQLVVTRIWSAAGLTHGSEGLIPIRPFRAPHHSLTEAALIGGGSPIRPGEVSLAHHGVLFIDEMPELPRRVLESLRQPVEDREVVICRARHTVKLPCSFMLVGAANPCPCGWLGHVSGRCTCRPEEIQRYIGRMSGALLDRIDLIVEAPSLTAGELLSSSEGESSAAVQARVESARRRQTERQGVANAALPGTLLRKTQHLPQTLLPWVEQAANAFQLSARSLDRVLKVARTSADLAGEAHITECHVQEALRYRQPTGWGQN